MEGVSLRMKIHIIGYTEGVQETLAGSGKQLYCSTEGVTQQRGAGLGAQYWTEAPGTT